MIMNLLTDLRFALRSLARVKGLAATVIVTLALGIGANTAMFSVVRGVLLLPLANRDEDTLVYIRQSAQGIGADNATFSVPEIQDLRARVKTLAAFGDFSTIDFTMVGLGEPRVVRAGVVGGSYFEVMGLRPVMGRLLRPADDGPDADGAVVLTHRFWRTALKSDPTLMGRTVRLGSRSATIIGVLEPSVPYPAETEIVANVVTSPHHLSATMVTGRVHRMTELFARLAPGVDLDAARAELRAVHGAIVREHPEAYPPKSDFRIEVVRLRDQITSAARTILLVLLAASALVFIVACSNVANLILARSVRREGELAIRAALGASAGALRRTLLAESLLLCGAGAILGVVIARPMVAVLARYAARFSVRALDLTVDASLLWVGVSLAVAAAVLLAFVPRLPSTDAANGFGLSTGTVRITSPPASLRGDADRGIVRPPRGRGNASDDPPCSAAGAHRHRHPQRPRAARARRLVRAHAGAGHRVLRGGHAAHHGAPRGGARRRRHDGPVARSRRLRSGLPVLGGRLRARGRRGRCARAVPDRFTRVLRGARRPDHRRPRLQRSRSSRLGAGRDREPEPRAADVLDPGRGQ
jgi:predicted permease